GGRLAQERVEPVALPLPGGDNQGVRLGGVHRHVDDARLVVYEFDLFPGRPAVSGLVQAAVGVGAVEPAQRADVNGVGVLRVDDDLADLEGLFQAHALPGLTTVGGLVDAIAVGDAIARVALAGADPDDVLVRRGHAHVADGDGFL